MKTFNYPIKELFNKGLRPLEESPRNGSYLTAISNGRVTKGGLVQADKFIREFALDESAQVFSTYKGLFILTGSTLYSYINSVLTIVLSDLPLGNLWSHADFGEYLLFTNGEVNLIRDPITGSFATDDGTVFPLSACICSHRGRLILGGPKQHIGTGEAHSNWILWSDINELAFIDIDSPEQSRRNLAGYMPMRWQGNILRVAPMNDKIVVYGDNGVTALFLTSTDTVASTYGVAQVHGEGIKGQGAMTTNGKEEGDILHYFIDTTGWLYTLTKDLKLERLGYKEFLT